MTEREPFQLESPLEELGDRRPVRRRAQVLDEDSGREPHAPKGKRRGKFEPRPAAEPYDYEKHMEACRAESARLRRETYERWGIDPDAPDAEDLRRAELEARQVALGEGWTFIDGEPRRMSEWSEERRAQLALEKDVREGQAEIVRAAKRPTTRADAVAAIRAGMLPKARR